MSIKSQMKAKNYYGKTFWGQFMKKSYKITEKAQHMSTLFIFIVCRVHLSVTEIEGHSTKPQFLSPHMGSNGRSSFKSKINITLDFGEYEIMNENTTWIKLHHKHKPSVIAFIQVGGMILLGLFNHENKNWHICLS